MTLEVNTCCNKFTPIKRPTPGNPIENTINNAQTAIETRRIIREELRMKELVAKLKTGTITDEESAELATLKRKVAIEMIAEKISKIQTPKVIYYI